MLNKKTIFCFTCLLLHLFIHAESGTISFITEPKNPHHEYYFTNNRKQNRYRIQMHTPHYAYYIDTKTCSHYECFPNFEMGISREEGGFTYIIPNYSCLSIFPEIIFKDENLKDVFSIKGTSREEGGYNYNCYATDWEIHEKGLVLDIFVIDYIWKDNDSKKLKRVYLELKEDGKYYESENADNFGELKKSYSAYDFIDRIVDLTYLRNFYFFGYSIYKMGNGRNIESVLISNILYYNKVENGIEFITPYGCGFFDFKTESMSLVPKEKYLGKKFTYTPFYPTGSKFKEKKKIITEEDFVLPDITVPIREDKLEIFSIVKQRDMKDREKEQSLKAELLAN